MTKIVPSTLILDQYGEPMPTGRLKDRSQRRRLAEMKDRADAAPPGQRNALMVDYEDAMFDAQEKLTLGGAIVRCMEIALDGDDKVHADSKTERMLLGMDILRAGEGQQIDLKPEQIVMIKQRISQSYNNFVVGQIVRLLEGKEALPNEPAQTAA